MDSGGLSGKLKILSVLVSLWSVSYAVIMMVRPSDLIDNIDSYIFICVSVFVAVITMIKSVRTGSRLILMGALGFSCLALGNVYFALLSFVDRFPDKISVGNFSLICCYLFFLSTLIGLKPEEHRHKLFFTSVILVSVIATIACAVAVVSDISAILIVAVLLLDSLCIIVSSTLLPDKNSRYFATVMLIISSIDLTGVLVSNTFVLILISAASPVLYLIMADALIKLKAGQINE